MAHGPWTISHFTHPHHPLVKYNNNADFICDGCKTLGSGARYRCNACNFDLHEYCGTCPGTLTTFMHPHPLKLLVRKPEGKRTNDRDCNVCGESVDGLFYWCNSKGCNFNVHPFCTQLPQSLSHKLHPDHPLTFQAPKKDGCCRVCGLVCDSWRYRCVTCCNIDVHFECVLSVPCDDHDTKSRQGPSCPSQQRNGGHDYGYGGASKYHNMYSGANYGYGPNGAYNYGNAAGSSPYYNMYNPGYGSMYNPGYATYQQGYNFMYNNGPINYQTQEGGAINSMKPGKMVYSLVSKIALGVLSNVIFGFTFPGLG